MGRLYAPATLPPEKDKKTILWEMLQVFLHIQINPQANMTYLAGSLWLGSQKIDFTQDNS
jgi:hypothetical protein